MRRFIPLILTSLLLLASLRPALAAPPEVVFEQVSPFDSVYVVDVSGRRFLRFGSVYGDDQSGLDLLRQDVPVLEYIPLTLAGLVAADKLERGLVIGFGAGSVTRLWHRAAPSMQIDSVEIDPVVTAVAFTHFGFPSHELLPIHVMDGRQFVQQSSGGYDVVLLDAYGAGDAPYHLTTLEFYREVQARLAPGGVVMANMVAETDATVLAMMRTFCDAFPGALRFDTPHDGNIVLIGKIGGRLVGADLGGVADLAAKLAITGDGIAPTSLPDDLDSAGLLRDAPGTPVAP